MWRIAEALTRLVAPILSFTAEEVWPLLPKVEGRLPSVHLALFPDIAEIVPGNTSVLLREWEQLLTLRDEVLKVLEEERAAKNIGKSSEARVTVGWLNGPGEDATSDLFDRYAAYLPELFGTSQVEVDHAQVFDATIARGAFYVKAAAAEGIKCERCWRYTLDNGQDARFPTVCLRCAEALEAVGFAPYEAPVNEESQA